MDFASMSQNIRPKDKYENLVLALLEQQAGVEKLYSYPIAAQIDPSSVCHLRCPICFHGQQPAKRSFDIMKWELYEHIVDELGPYLFRATLLKGGEPLLNKRFPDMVAKIKQYGVITSTDTNFSLELSDAKLESLIDCGLDNINICLDGFSKDTYARYRIGGDFDLVVSNMTRLVKLKKKRGVTSPQINWQYVVFSFNQHELPAARRLARDLGVKFFAKAPFVKDHLDWLPTIEGYVKNRYKSHSEISEVTTSSSDSVSEIISKMLSKIKSGYPCDFLYHIATINANGSISACCANEPEERDFGKVTLNNTFHEVWNNETFQKARRIVNSKNPENVKALDEIICSNCVLPDYKREAQSLVRSCIKKVPEELKAMVAEFLPHQLSNDLSLREHLRRITYDRLHKAAQYIKRR